MPDLRTEITEIVTGLGMLGLPSLAYGLERPPAALANVAPGHWDALRTAWREGTYRAQFEAAWANGEAFLAAGDALRNRLPRVVEWKGAHRPPAYEQLPADLRVDHVFLVSCKYQSRILFNPSPAHLFDRCLSDRSKDASIDWYESAAPAAYQDFYRQVRAAVAASDLPGEVTHLRPEHRTVLKERLGRRWPTDLLDPYRTFCRTVSDASAARWAARLPTGAAAEQMLWRLLRFASAPYYLLGESDGGPLRLRIFTPWDWRLRFRLEQFLVAPDADAGQPQVRWTATVTDRADGMVRSVQGHVEIRWSHGRFCGHPEAKVYLDTPHSQVPGYEPL